MGVESQFSGNLEKLVESLFIAEVRRIFWSRGIYELEVFRPEVDTAGWDVGFSIGDQLRFVQLKMKKASGRNSRFKIHKALELKPGGCVVVAIYEVSTIKLGPFLWYGNQPSTPMSQLPNRIAKHTKGNKDGDKKERPNIHVLNLGDFKKLNSMTSVVDMLFDFDFDYNYYDASADYNFQNTTKNMPCPDKNNSNTHNIKNLLRKIGVSTFINDFEYLSKLGFADGVEYLMRTYNYTENSARTKCRVFKTICGEQSLLNKVFIYIIEEVKKVSDEVKEKAFALAQKNEKPRL